MFRRVTSLYNYNIFKVTIWTLLDFMTDIFGGVFKWSVLPPPCKNKQGIVFNSSAAVWVAEQPFTPTRTPERDDIWAVVVTALVKQSTKNCFTTVSPLWRTLKYTLTLLCHPCEGAARSFHHKLPSRGHQESKKASKVATSPILADTFPYLIFTSWGLS